MKCDELFLEKRNTNAHSAVEKKLRIAQSLTAEIFSTSQALRAV